MNNLVTWAVYAGIVLMLAVGIHLGVKSGFDDDSADPDGAPVRAGSRRHGPRPGAPE